MRVLTGVGRSGTVTIPSVRTPRSSRACRIASPAGSSPTTPSATTFAPRVWRLWQAFAAPPSRVSVERYRRIRTGASRETRSGRPNTYSSATRAPTTRSRALSNPWMTRGSPEAAGLCTARPARHRVGSVHGDAHFRPATHRRHYTDGSPAGKRFFGEHLGVDTLHEHRTPARRKQRFH